MVPWPKLRAWTWPGSWSLAGTQGRTHVGQGEGAPAAALVGLLVAPQLTEGSRLAEQCPDVFAVQAQRLFTVLQRLLIQALPERSRQLAGQRPLPSLGLLPPARLSTGGRSDTVRGIHMSSWALAGHWRGPSNITGMGLVAQTCLLPYQPSVQTLWAEGYKGAFERK